jgi:hypothetical protein
VSMNTLLCPLRVYSKNQVHRECTLVSIFRQYLISHWFYPLILVLEKMHSHTFYIYNIVIMQSNLSVYDHFLLMMSLNTYSCCYIYLKLDGICTLIANKTWICLYYEGILNSYPKNHHPLDGSGYSVYNDLPCVLASNAFSPIFPL